MSDKTPQQKLLTFLLPEESFNDLENSLKTLELFEVMASEIKQGEAIQADLVSAALGLVVEKLASVLDSSRGTFGRYGAES